MGFKRIGLSCNGRQTFFLPGSSALRIIRCLDRLDCNDCTCLCLINLTSFTNLLTGCWPPPEPQTLSILLPTLVMLRRTAARAKASLHYGY
ncbi:hypothetical protein GDO78_020620 [Eleutherodactylus coqui]|uniref:Uncharacterized protein n=1 Tax=Eleutherodactylus coqui TaxID=57060 RepID=A0A8J6BDT5_ELECQ|nr:hypothetical protein GDO78_020620 [Eleutherodactylus coqui]